MIHTLTVLNWLLPLLYLGVLAHYATAFFLHATVQGRRWLAPVVLGLHVAFLVLLGLHMGRMVPVTNYEMLSAMAAGVVAVQLAVEWTTREQRTGVFVLLAAFVLQYTSSVFVSPSLGLKVEGVVPGAYWGHLHFLPALLVYVALTVSAIYSILHLAALRDLREHKFGLLFDRLPPLETLARMNWHSLLVGFVFITVTMISGAVLAATHRDVVGATTNKAFLKMFASLAAWVIFAGTIVGRLVVKWDAARVSRYTIVGCLVVAAMLVASIFLTH